MNETVTLQQIYHEIQNLKNEVTYIKNHMIDADTILDEEDYKSLKSFREEKRQKTLTSHATLRKALGL